MIAIVDYGMGNLRSVHKAIEAVGGDAKIVCSPEDVAKADKIILPGVGAFRDAIAKVRSVGLDEALVEAVNKGVPLMGICLGLQLLFEVSFEDGEHTGLGIVAGKVLKFDFEDVLAGSSEKLSIPHMGWNSIELDQPCVLFEGLDQSPYVYFAHSYYVQPTNDQVIATRTHYGFPFVSSICQDNVMGTQFHPEKSQSVGLKILKNFVRL